MPRLRSVISRDHFLTILEQTRKRYRFVVVGYVVMPEHIHLLVSEPEIGDPSTVMQVLKQRSARALLPKHKNPGSRQTSFFEQTPRVPFWQARFYDFNVWTEKKRIEKLKYMHRNPVKRDLALSPEDWRWSSHRFYALDEAGVVRVNEGWSKISFVIVRCELSAVVANIPTPALCTKRKGLGTPCVDCASEIKIPGHTHTLPTLYQY